MRNRGRYVERSGRRKQELWAARTQLLLDHFADHPCTDCGETDPLVLEFDHLRDKRFNIGTKLATFPWEVILEEIAKCDVVCANCHRRRTARRRGSNRARLTASEDIPALPKDSTHSG